MLTAPDETDSKRDEVTVVDAGFRPFVTGPGATARYAVGYKLKADCGHSHDFPIGMSGDLAVDIHDNSEFRSRLADALDPK